MLIQEKEISKRQWSFSHMEMMAPSEKKMVLMFLQSPYISYSEFPFLLHCLGYSELSLKVIVIIFPNFSDTLLFWKKMNIIS